MPTNPQHLLQGIREFGKSLVAAHASEVTTRAEALRLLGWAAEAPDQVGARLQAAASDATLRCAGPSAEPVASAFPSEPTAPPPAILSVDGSQIMPDRHAEILFGLINVGAVVFVPGSGAAPTISSETQLLFGEQLHGGADRLVSEGDLALLRDSAERRSLLKHALAPGSIALMDGTLELWGPKDPGDQRAFDRALAEYTTQLHELRGRDLTLAGYVDKPGADLVVRMLEIAQAQSPQGIRARDHRPLRGATDRHLFGTLLGAGYRSAVFELISSSRARYFGELALHFFYLNVGDAAHPLIARVEIPRWVAADRQRIQTLHAALLEQCRFMGARPYPYILHRAHETARISLHEAAQIRLQLLLEMRSAGLDPEAVSGKSSAKAVSQSGGRK